MKTATRITYQGVADCVQLSNGSVNVVVSTRGGPRVLHYGLSGHGNVLGWCPEAVTDTPWGPWRPVGGHRLWTAPEAMPRSYADDSAPAEVEAEDEHTVIVRSPTDRAGIRKWFSVTLAAAGSEVVVRHALVNDTPWTIEVAPWALTILRGGGTVVIPNERRATHAERLDAVRSLGLWAYTDFRDPRWTLGARYLLLRCDPARAAPQKVGAANHRGWCAYVVDDAAFVKRHTHRAGAVYPDTGCSVEAFTAGAFVELETLGPVQRLAPGGACDTHEERWSLHAIAGLRDDLDPEDAVDAALAPLSLG